MIPTWRHPLLAARAAVLLLAAAVFAVMSTAAATAAPPPANVVKLGGTVERRASGGIELAARVEIAPGFHINANRPDADFLIPTVLTVTAPGAQFDAPSYPDPVAKAFAFSEGKKLLVYDGAIDIRARSASVPTGPIRAALRYQACDEERCLAPRTIDVTLALPDEAGGAGATASSPGDGRGADEARSGLSDPPGGPASGERTPWLAKWLEGASLPAAIAMTLVLGLGLNLTPCVYPLISVTVAYFGGQARPGARAWPIASAYVAGITLSFAILGLSAALFGGLVGAPLQHPVVPVALALVFVTLAGASFGLYEIRAPRFLLERFGKSSAGIGGALLMGLTMGIVAAPCIGPVVLGLLVYVGARHDLALGFLLFLTMGLGMGLPYVVLASAAGSIARLPRSGEWLRWMNRLFGVLLLAMALYFVSPLVPDGAMRVVVPVFLAAAGVYLGFVEPSGRSVPGFMTARRFVGTAVVGFAAWLAFFAAEPTAQARAGIRWEPLSVAALDRAIGARRPAIVEFAAEWCLPCGVMARTTFVDPDVTREAERFSMLQADVTESTPATEALLGRFGVMGVPTMIFYDGRGNEVDRIVGYVDAQKLTAMMRRVAGPGRGGQNDAPPDRPPRAPAEPAAAHPAGATRRAPPEPADPGPAPRGASST
ncbi:MAG TPA: cytochrome c biogenesis protein CcdA [Candidatus Binatia bacterium]|nr:cytochrome c biogenesis protein CcdA [Candidatus Binatia bacterium]